VLVALNMATLELNGQGFSAFTVKPVIASAESSTRGNRTLRTADRGSESVKRSEKSAGCALKLVDS